MWLLVSPLAEGPKTLTEAAALQPAAHHVPLARTSLFLHSIFEKHFSVCLGAILPFLPPVANRRLIALRVQASQHRP
jgi:hypothetical protein